MLPDPTPNARTDRQLWRAPQLVQHGRDFRLGAVLEEQSRTDACDLGARLDDQRRLIPTGPSLTQDSQRSPTAISAHDPSRATSGDQRQVSVASYFSENRVHALVIGRSRPTL